MPGLPLSRRMRPEPEPVVAEAPEVKPEPEAKPAAAKPKAKPAAKDAPEPEAG